MPTKKPLNTEFSEKVRSVVAAIPAGEVLTYSQVAKKAGNEKAARAVARVMSQNYDPNIPCHRVIRADGQVGEYNRGGSTAKLTRLAEEGWNGQLS
jgi:methylated-DNA-[protein]-cysteine S-methyltransferase